MTRGLSSFTEDVAHSKVTLGQRGEPGRQAVRRVLTFRYLYAYMFRRASRRAIPLIWIDFGRVERMNEVSEVGETLSCAQWRNGDCFRADGILGAIRGADAGKDGEQGGGPNERERHDVAAPEADGRPWPNKPDVLPRQER